MRRRQLSVDVRLARQGRHTHTAWLRYLRDHPRALGRSTTWRQEQTLRERTPPRSTSNLSSRRQAAGAALPARLALRWPATEFFHFGSSQ